MCTVNSRRGGGSRPIRYDIRVLNLTRLLKLPDHLSIEKIIGMPMQSRVDTFTGETPMELFIQKEN